MAKIIKRKCITCGKEYEYCNTCSKYNHLEAWHNIYHDENCRKIFNIATNYHAGLINPEEAAKQFTECDLSHKENIKPSIRELIDELLADYTAHIIDESVVNETIETEEKPVIKKRGRRAKIKPIDEALNSD